ncbi:MAG: ATP-binding protein [Alphaproteobacteria bacterium]
MTNKYSITLSLNVLNHLGINLYSNIPAVLSETVANAWDADAENVEINLDVKKGTIIVTDNGHGMTEQDLNEKFLNVGYMRREHGEAITPRLKRRVMGRKGIGKLSLFSIASIIEVHSVKNGQKNGLIMNLDKIKSAINEEEKGTYHPEAVPIKSVKITKGTKIILTKLRKDIKKTNTFLKKRLARRFGVIGPKNKFNVKVNGTEISIKDRDYFQKLQYIWTFGTNSKEFSVPANNAEHKHLGPGKIKRNGKTYNIRGWIGTFTAAGDAKADDGESLNNISVMVRGKLAQENILDEFGDAGIYASYLIGEIEADFLDEDNASDIATSSRQRLIEDDPRYQELKKFIGLQLDQIRGDWSEYRNSAGEKKARENPSINKWFNELPTDSRKTAKSLFGKINQLKVEESDKRTLFMHSVIAVETMRYKGRLDELDNISMENVSALKSIFNDFDDIEATLYHQITSERIKVIEALQEKVAGNAKEKLIQQYLFDHLWLLDPMWERATETPVMEQAVDKEFKKVNAKLSQEEKKGRLDIKYKTAAGGHVIIELKRPNVTIKTLKLVEQVNKYRTALQKCLDETQMSDDPIEIVCILGKYPTDYKDAASQTTLKGFNVRIVLYNSLLDQAYKAYGLYLDRHKNTGRLTTLLENISSGETKLATKSSKKTKA